MQYFTHKSYNISSFPRVLLESPNILFWGKLPKYNSHGFGGCRHVFYFEAYGFQLVDSASADWRRALQAS